MTFTITVLPSGRSFNAEPEETLLAAGIRQGVGLPYGCKDGACGSCKCKLLSGRVLHGPHQSKALSAEEEAKGWVLTCSALAHSDLVIEARQVSQAGALPIKKMPVRVSAIERAASDVLLLRLQLPAAERFQYLAGQYVDFLLRDGVRRSYSIANAPHTQELQPSIELHLRHMPGGLFTEHAFNALKEKDILRIEGPYGSFFLREDSDKPVILLASGTGFAPMKAIVQHLLHLGSRRPVTLYWGARRPADLYQSDWVREQQALLPSLKFVPVVSDALPEDGWDGRSGFVHHAVLQDFPDLSGHQVYACGAPIVVDSARTDFVAQAGLPKDDFFADAFTSAADQK
ncbi:CDP-6-deoxy-delta-3,4-glucoseen reductase [Hydrogenophaga sp.]|uniref:CDP-6-deoxy-delta-3,4-glucoseen reductase n=1 Tax=Hydrogenophaga sp. TaxID=1904254 RepID=UPI00198C85C0|nr:CDP-6-deoxy-delta-3,4-glucoseen reductase [Hydrogenophaga sp.]MBD3892789.1 CDP-6-deoxy-delta-3,4-glucoseen reductase [Hydrogenophaga sp.]